MKVRRIFFYLAHILLFSGLILVGVGLIIPEAPMVIEKAEVIENKTYSEDEIGGFVLKQKEEIQPNISTSPREPSEIMETFQIDSYNNETQENFRKIINDKKSNFTTHNVTENGEFYVEIDNQSYFFESSKEYTNPIFISIFGFFVIISSWLYISINEDQYQNEFSSEFEDHGLYKEDGDTKWTFYTDNKENDDDIK